MQIQRVRDLGGFWLRVFYETAVKISAKATSSESSAGAGGTTSVSAPSHGYGLQASAPHCMDLFTSLLGHPHHMAAGFPQTESFKSKSKGASLVAQWLRIRLPM